MADYDSDLEFLSLWSLQRTREEGVWSHLESKSVHLHFADAMISAPEFALRFPPSGSPAIVARWDFFDLSLQESVAGSITEFCEKHLAHQLPGPCYD